MHDTYFRRTINWFYGEDAYLHQPVPPEVGEKHVTELLGQHPYHPYNPDLPAHHPCAQENAAFAFCMDHPDNASLELHMKHVTCYHPMKVNLMKCLSREKRRLKAAMEEKGGNPPTRTEGTS